MQYYDINLPINSAQDVGAQGRYIYYYSGSTPSALDNTIIVKAGNSGSSMYLKPGQSLRMDDKEKEPGNWRLTQKSNLEIITGVLLIGSGEFRDANLVGTISAGAMTVSNSDAAAVPMRHQNLSTVTNIGAVSIGIVETALVSDATLKQIRFRNMHAAANVAIGPAGITLATAAIILAPGDTWLEEDAAGIAWKAISDTAATPVAVMGLK